MPKEKVLRSVYNAYKIIIPKAIGVLLASFETWTFLTAEGLSEL